MNRAIPIFLLLAISLGVSPGQDQKIDFEKQIWPILERSCVKCHKAPFEENGRTIKPKAGLRMDGAWAISLGSENGAVMTRVTPRIVSYGGGPISKKTTMITCPRRGRQIR